MDRLRSKHSFKIGLEQNSLGVETKTLGAVLCGWVVGMFRESRWEFASSGRCDDMWLLWPRSGFHEQSE